MQLLLQTPCRFTASTVCFKTTPAISTCPLAAGLGIYVTHGPEEQGPVIN